MAYNPPPLLERLMMHYVADTMPMNITYTWSVTRTLLAWLLVLLNMPGNTEMLTDECARDHNHERKMATTTEWQSFLFLEASAAQG